MPKMTSNDFREVETLTRSAENVLRKLIGFLVGKISLVKLQEMVRFIYVEEAENQLKTEFPTKSVALTKLALLTGLDTRTLTRTRNSESYKKPFHEKSSFLREFTPAAAILDNWGSSDEFIDPQSNQPKRLCLKGKFGSFEQLFAKTIKSRGITQQSLLDRLVESGAVRIDTETETIELLQQSYLPTHSDDQLGAFEMGYAAAANLMETIVHNFESASNKDKFFQRGVWTHRLPVHCRHELRNALTKILESAELDSRQLLAEAEVSSENPSQMTAGVSLFYFEDNVPKAKD